VSEIVNTEDKEKKYPPLSHACVGAIVYRKTEKGKKEYLIQKRDKPSTPYHNKWEFPVGILEDAKGERISAPLQALKEVQEEAGLNPENAKIITEHQVKYESADGDVVEGFAPYYQTHQTLGGNPWYMTVFLVEASSNAEIASESNETKEVQWVDEDSLKQMLTDSTDDFFPLQVPAWQYHFRNSVEE
jgi:8-oxo-dGTP pyrophosphatase MutT (NUDIX family)